MSVLEYRIRLLAANGIAVDVIELAHQNHTHCTGTMNTNRSNLHFDKSALIESNLH